MKCRNLYKKASSAFFNTLMICGMTVNMLMICGMTTCSVESRAQRVQDMFLSIPDTVIPYLDRAHLDENVIPTSFGNTAKVITKSDDFLCLTIDSAKVLEIIRLPYTQVSQDSVFCVLHTVNMPERDTKVTLYDSKWKIINNISFDDITFTAKPDTMSTADYNKLLLSMEIKMIEAEYNGNQELRLNMNIPNSYLDDKERMKGIFLQKYVKWNGKTFK